MTLTAPGVVDGDIGTSPLYAIRECFHGPLAIPVSPANVLGVLSLIVWWLLLIISLKYLTFILRANNKGEGGILALMVRAGRDLDSARGRWIVMLLGLFGAGLLDGGGIITSAISVLRAVERIGVARPSLEPYVVPVTVRILVALFLLQRRGTARMGRLFGPVMLVWFLTLAVLGGSEIIRHPKVLAAINPDHSISFFLRNKVAGFLILGSNSNPTCRIFWTSAGSTIWTSPVRRRRSSWAGLHST